jgi:hypothetical protein
VRIRKTLTLAAVAGAVSILPSPAHAATAVETTTACQTVTVQTGEHHGAGTDNEVFLVERRTANRVKLDRAGNTFENGANEEFENICGLYVADPAKGADFIELVLRSGGRDNWQVTSVTVGERTFNCGNRWVVPGDTTRCIDARRA